MDDAKINTGHPIGVKIMLLDRNGGGNRQPQSSAVGQQGDRSDELGRVGKRAGQPNPQLGLAASHRQPHLQTLDRERAVVATYWDQTALAPRKAGLLLVS